MKTENNNKWSDVFYRQKYSDSLVVMLLLLYKKGRAILHVGR